MCSPVAGSDSCTVALVLPLASSRPSGLNATASTHLVWPVRVRRCSPVAGFHSRMCRGTRVVLAGAGSLLRSTWMAGADTEIGGRQHHVRGRLADVIHQPVAVHLVLWLPGHQGDRRHAVTGTCRAKFAKGTPDALLAIWLVAPRFASGGVLDEVGDGLAGTGAELEEGAELGAGDARVADEG